MMLPPALGQGCGRASQIGLIRRIGPIRRRRSLAAPVEIFGPFPNPDTLRHAHAAGEQVGHQAGLDRGGLWASFFLAPQACVNLTDPSHAHHLFVQFRPSDKQDPHFAKMAREDLGMGRYIPWEVSTNRSRVLRSSRSSHRKADPLVRIGVIYISGPS